MLDAKIAELESKIRGDTDLSGFWVDYTLVDAILDGCSVTKQAFNTPYDDEDRVCALTAAWLAVKARHMI